MNFLADDENLEVTREGLLGLVAGKAKEAAGALVGNDELAREGRLQQAEVDAHIASDPEPGEQQETGEEVARGDGAG